MRLGCTFERKRPFVHSFRTEGGHATIFEGDSNFWRLLAIFYFRPTTDGATRDTRPQ